MLKHASAPPLGRLDNRFIVKAVENKKAGYEYLLAYKITVPIYDYTVKFCSTYFPYIPSHPDRTKDQMIQAARSGMQNILEGYKQQSLEGYIKLSGVARGSLEELLKDYQAFARQKKLAIYSKDKAVREIREIGKIWEIIKQNPTLPSHPNFPNLPKETEKAVNLQITLINQANYLLDKLIESLRDKFVKEGGFRENLFKKRLAFRQRT